MKKSITKSIKNDVFLYDTMEKILPDLIKILPFNGEKIFNKVEIIKKRIGCSYTDVLWKALSVLPDDADIPLDGKNYGRKII